MMPNLLPHAASAIDATLFDTVRTRLFTAVIGDVMDAKGLTHQFLPPEIRALAPDLVIVGRAMPVREADCHTDVSTKVAPFGLLLEALGFPVFSAASYAREQEIIAKALEKVAAEEDVRDGILAGRSAAIWQ